MSVKGNKPGRFSHSWLHRQQFAGASFALSCFFLFSALVHAILLWQFRYIPPYLLKAFSLSNIVVVTPLDSEPGASSSTAPPGSKGALRARPVPRARLAAPPGSDRPSSGESSTIAGGPSGAGPGLGDVVTDGSGVGAGGIGVPADPAGAGQGNKGGGLGRGTGAGTGKGRLGPPGAGVGPPTADRFAIAVPPAIQRTTSPYESEVYAEIDFYTLYTPDLRHSVNVPANQVCLEGNIIRTLERQVISHVETDISKCRYDLMGDDQEKMRCPPEAHRTVVSFNNFLSSPVNYSVNQCAAYDRSSCFWQLNDDGPDVEICRLKGKYDGIWMEGTMFHYPCAKSTTQFFSHPLQYEVRFMQDVEFPDDRIRRRFVHREKRPLAQCQ